MKKPMKTRENAARRRDAGPPSENLRHNLLYLCSFYPSISEVCRRLGINRQQFNKYTSGSAFPSVFVLTRIANFFGVDTEELCLPPEELKQTFTRRIHTHDAHIESRWFADQIRQLSESSSSILDLFSGLYHRYYYSFDQAGHVVRTLFQIRKVDGAYVTKHIERISYDGGRPPLTTFKYDGMAVCASNCIFITEIETLLKSCVAHAAFPIIPRPGQPYLSGIQMSLSSSAGRPGASRVILERISPSVSVREALRRCGVFSPDGGDIKREILTLIDNLNSTGTGLFLPRIF